MRYWLLLALLSSCVGPKAADDSEIRDADGDGHAARTDCDDAASDVYPGAPERCDGLDQDCDGVVDEDTTDGLSWYADADGDAFGDPSLSRRACAPPDGFVPDATDCDDGDPAVSPDATEVCDDIDNDCDTATDEPDAADAPVWFADSDGDGFGDSSASTPACTQPSAFVADATDCDDGDPAVSPGATELCDSIDNDCDTLIDEPDAADALTWFADSDGDGFGDPGFSTPACTQPFAFVGDATDCDDGDNAVFPGATELCDNIDNDCDTTIDEPDAADAFTWFADSDGDGFGDATLSTPACSQPAGFVSDATDCDDGDISVSPAATEFCDNIDNDCDTTIDEPDAADAIVWFPDSDGDGYGDQTAAQSACTDPGGLLTVGGDCDDADGTIHPGASETDCWDGVDQDCSVAYSACTQSVLLSPDADLSIYGTASDGFAGHRLSVGDLNADATTDLAIMSFANNGDGAAYIFAGPLAPGSDTVASATWTFTGALDVLGFYDSAIVDLDGSGMPDVILAAPYSSRPSAGVGGAVWFFSDPAPGTVPETAARAVWLGYSGQRGGTGWSIAPLGDQDGDGDGEIALAAPGGTWPGIVDIVSGSDVGTLDAATAAQTTLSMSQQSAGFGTSVANLGDMTGDGITDLGVGDYAYDGFWVIPGPLPAGSYAANSLGSFIVSESGGGLDLPDDVVGGGDLNADGYDDMLVTTRQNRSFYIVLGPVTGPDTLANAYAQVETYVFTSAIAAGGDLDGSGTPDIVATVNYRDFTPAWPQGSLDQVQVYLDLPQGFTSGTGDILIPFANYSDYMADALMADLDGDGLDDLIHGSPGRLPTDFSWNRLGAVFVYFGRDL